VACPPPPNTPMPGPTLLTTPSDNSIGARTSTQRSIKLPIGYHGTPQTHLQNCPLPFDDHHQNLIRQYKARPHPPSQRHPDPLSSFARIRNADIPTERAQSHLRQIQCMPGCHYQHNCPAIFSRLYINCTVGKMLRTWEIAPTLTGNQTDV